MSKRKVGGVILAAGASERMGCPKLLLPWGADTIIGAVLDNALAAGLDDLVLVSGAERALVEAEALRRGVRCVYNPDYLQGQSTSMKRGLSALAPEHAALFILGDQPLVSSAVMAALADAYRQKGGTAFAPRGEDGVRGNPSLIAPALFEELRQVEGDVGGRPVLRAHIRELQYVDVGGEGVLIDIDTPEQYRKCRE